MISLAHQLKTFLRAAADDDLICGGIDAQRLYVDLFGPPDTDETLPPTPVPAMVMKAETRPTSTLNPRSAWPFPTDTKPKDH